MIVELKKKLTFISKKALLYKRKNFAAVIFFDFFFKGKKVISLPQHFSIIPWGLDKMDKNSIEDNDIFFPKKCPGIRHFDYIKNYFYLGVDYSLARNWNDNHTKSVLYLLTDFFNQGSKKLIIHAVLPESKSQPIAYSSAIKSNTLEKFCFLFEKEIVLFLREEGEKVINKILVELEEGGPVIRLESRDDSSCEELGTEDVVFSFLDEKNINFCSEVPSRKRINLEESFDEKELISFCEEISNFGLGNNPFQGPIDDLPEEYKKYLLGIFGPGKWEYTNLEIEKLDLSIEELVCLNIICHSFGVSGASGLIYSEPVFFSTEITTAFWYQSVPYLYFWYRLKEVVTNKN